jgi:hypothetical protein
MDYRQVLGQFFPDKGYYCEDSYESIEWWDTVEKPTDEELIGLYEGVKHTWALDEMRQKRNRMLICCDFKALPDYPNRDVWVVYRQELRDLPDNWNGIYPTEPDN